MRLTVLDDVTWDGKPVPGERTHALLRALVDAGPRGMSEAALVEEIWDADLPEHPSKALQVVVSRARSATAAGAIERTERGYRLGLALADVDAWAVRPEGLRLAAEGRYAEALPLLEQAGAQQADDDVVGALVRSEAAVRGVPVALERFELYREELADRLGIDPSPELQALHVELLARDQPVRSGVHFDPDELIGRDADAAALSVLIRTHRVVSIVGAGGLGKTRLAHVAGRTAEQPIVHFVELAGVTSPEGVGVEVADRLGVRESLTSRPLALRQADLHARIVDAVGTVPTLLIIDNCEHVIDAVADLVSLLIARTPALTVLTTSRAPLGLAAERVYLLPELSPDDAVALFRERATAARPDITLDDGEIHALVERLDGLPLAIELAAARVRAMSVAEISRRLDNRFGLLRGGNRDAPERHQTLLAVIDWSWNLLSEEQRIALRRLSVFRDGFALDGAGAVLGYDAIDVIEALAEQSLVVVAEALQPGDGGPDGLRYRLLETVREFGRMQLVDAGDDVDTETRLRGWAVAFAAAEAARLYSPDQIASVNLIRSEEGNLVDVLRRCLAERDVSAVAPIFAALATFWTIEGAHVKVINLSEPVEDVLVDEPTPDGLVDFVRMALMISLTNGMIFRALGTSRAFGRLKELGPGTGRLASTVKVLLAAAGDSWMMRHDALLELVDDPDPFTARTASTWVSQLLENDGDLAAARASARRALALCDDSDGPWMRGLLSAQLSSFAMQAGDFDEADAFALEAMPILQALGAAEDFTEARTVRAVIALHRGDYDEAERLLDGLEDDEATQSIFGGALTILCCRAELLLARGEVDRGLGAYADVVAVMRSRGIPGLDLPDGFQPWVLYPQAALVATAARHGRLSAVRAQRDDMLAKMTVTLAGDGFIDVPITGTALFALGMWELVSGNLDAGSRLLAFAERFSFSRMFPSFDWTGPAKLADPALLHVLDEDSRRAPELRSDALRLLESLAG